MAALNVYLLGPGRIHLDDSGVAADVPPSCRHLLAYLLLKRRQRHSREVIADALWGPTGTRNARRRLNTVLWRLRSSIESSGTPRGTYLVSDQSGQLGFNEDSDYWLDVDVFERAALAATQSANDLAEDTAERLNRAVELYEGDVLETCYDDWLLLDRARLARLYSASMRVLMDWHRDAGRPGEAIRCGEALLERDPLREDVYRALMRLYADVGDRSQALSLFEQCKQLLIDELDVEPLPETTRLAAAIMRGTPHAVNLAGLDVGEVVAELERARSELRRITASLDRSLASLRRSLTD